MRWCISALLLALALPLWARQPDAGANLSMVSRFSLPQSAGAWLASATPQWWLYAASSSGQIAQFDTLGRELRQASKSIWLDASHLEAEAGVRLFLFSEEAQKGYWIDRLLGQSQEISLDENAFFSILSPAPDGGFWGFDTYTLSLIHLSFDGRLVQNTIPLLGTGLAESADELRCGHIAVGHGLVYALFQNKGLIAWSNTGAYLAKTADRSIQGFDLSGNYLYTWTQTELFQFQPDNLSQPTQVWRLPEKQWEDWSVSYPYLFGISGETVSVFRLLNGR